ncbi:MAG: protein YgfX [Methylophaga sp.]|uniref:protein YgfX n=1 Tax=Methylophaga sp. TaxID=2024840 RepID=UPI00299EE3F5|nr:protein YgfX [Methylophaga sp.]MDX1750073.1 protein YgfX [Methylophaga sp.]
MKKQDKGFYLPLARSRLLLIYSLLAHMLAVISVGLITVIPIVKILFIKGIYINQFLHIRRLGYIREYKKRPVTLINTMNEYWQIGYADSSKTSDLLVESARVNRFAVIIHFKSFNKKRLSLLIPKDSVDQEQFRQLRVRLKLAFFQQ